MYVLSDPAFFVRFEHRRGEVSVEITDTVSGTVWGPTPAFQLEILSLALQRIDLAERAETSLVQGEEGIDVTQTVQGLLHSASVTVRFTVEDGELVARILAEKIFEPRPELSLLAGVNLLPHLLYAGPDSQGHLVLPYRNGALCYPDRHSRASDRFLIYGEQKRWELMPMLPCTGAVRLAEHAALMAIVEQGDHDAECRVEIDGIGGGQTYFSLRYRYTPIDPVDPIERVARFALLRNAEAGYAGMGRRMHRHVLKTSGRGTLAERAVINPDLAYAANSFVLKIMHACKDVGPSNGSGQLRIFTTFADAMRQLSEIKRAGIEKLYVQLTGWNLEGHDGCWPSRFPVEPSLGGEAGLRELIRHGQALGFQMQLHDNYIDLLRCSPEFDPELCTGGVYGGPLKRGCWAGGINYAGWGLAYPDSLLAGQMEQVRDLGVQGVYYLDAIGTPLEISYNPDHGPARYRRAYAEGILRMIRSGRAVFGTCGVETGYLYCAREADYIGSSFLDFPPGPASELADEPVPLWFMAVKGHAFCMLNDTFQGAIDFGDGSHQSVSRRMLTMAEFGLLPRNEIVATAGGWGYPLEPALQAMKLEYDLIVGRLAGTALASLDDHAVVAGRPGGDDRVTISVYSDGTQVTCDYRNLQLTIDGCDYPLPNGFRKHPAVPQGIAPPIYEASVDRVAQQ